jgi:hypothetical protein
MTFLGMKKFALFEIWTQIFADIIKNQRALCAPSSASHLTLQQKVQA